MFPTAYQRIQFRQCEAAFIDTEGDVIATIHPAIARSVIIAAHRRIEIEEWVDAILARIETPDEDERAAQINLYCEWVRCGYGAEWWEDDCR